MHFTALAFPEFRQYCMYTLPTVSDIEPLPSMHLAYTVQTHRLSGMAEHAYAASQRSTTDSTQHNIPKAQLGLASLVRNALRLSR